MLIMLIVIKWLKKELFGVSRLCRFYWKRFAQSARPGPPTNAHLKSFFDLLGSFGVTFWAVRRAAFFIIVKMCVCCVIAFFCFMMFLRARKGLSFGALFRNLGALWYHFWVNFRSLEALWERWGPLLMSKSGLGPQRCPRRQNPENPLTFWDPIGSHFLNIFRFVGVCF